MPIITGEKAINLFHMKTQLAALGLEIKGLKHSRGSVYAHIKHTYNFKGNKQRVFEQFKQLIQEKENDIIRTARHHQEPH